MNPRTKVLYLFGLVSAVYVLFPMAALADNCSSSLDAGCGAGNLASGAAAAAAIGGVAGAAAAGAAVAGSAAGTVVQRGRQWPWAGRDTGPSIRGGGPHEEVPPSIEDLCKQYEESGMPNPCDPTEWDDEATKRLTGRGEGPEVVPVEPAP